MTPGLYNQNMQLVQTPDQVVVLNEMVHDSRINPPDGRPRPDIESWTGESRGHWEGDTLVVETTNFSDRHSYRGPTRDRRLFEWFTRTDADALLYEFTIDDFGRWTAPWPARIPMQWNPLPVYFDRDARVLLRPRRKSPPGPDLRSPAGEDPWNRKLTAIVEREGDGCIAVCPEVDVVSPGDTVVEALQDLQEALTLFFETASAEAVEGRQRDEVGCLSD